MLIGSAGMKQAQLNDAFLFVYSKKMYKQQENYIMCP